MENESEIFSGLYIAWFLSLPSVAYVCVRACFVYFARFASSGFSYGESARSVGALSSAHAWPITLVRFAIWVFTEVICSRILY